MAQKEEKPDEYGLEQRPGGKRGVRRKRMGEGLVVAAGIVHSARPLWSGSMLTFHHAAAPRARIRQQDSVAPPLAGSNLAKRERPYYNGSL